MIISEPRYAAAYYTDDGNSRIFDDLGELCTYHHANNEEVATFWAHDFDSEQWIDASQGAFVLSEEIQTPMDFGMVAFEDQSRAEDFADEVDGKVLDFAQFLTQCQMTDEGHDHSE